MQKTRERIKQGECSACDVPSEKSGILFTYCGERTFNDPWGFLYERRFITYQTAEEAASAFWEWWEGKGKAHDICRRNLWRAQLVLAADDTLGRRKHTSV